MKGFLFLLAFFLLDAFGVSDYLEVNEVTVKTFAKNSFSAKQKAISLSAEQAFDKLIDINFPEANNLKGKLSADQIQKCIYDYSIEQEKFSGKVYIGEFSIRFEEEKVLNLLHSHGILESERKLIRSKIAVYMEDYLSNPIIFKDVSVFLFSQKRIILNASSEFKKILKEKKVKFAEINV